MWKVYIDRHYMKEILYPKLQKFVGSEGTVLSIGFESYNSIDRELANISIEKWFVNDIRDVEVPPYVGQFILGDLPSATVNYPHFFRAIIDYGMLGFTPHKWDPSNITSHIQSYQKLLEPNGKLYLKWDLYWPKTNPEMWTLISPQLLKYLIPGSSYLQIDHRCPIEFKKQLITIQHAIKWQKESIVGYNWTGQKSRCDAYLHTEWTPRS